MANCNAPRLDDGAPLTADELRPYRTERPSGCNGNCNQGRACDCAPDVDLEPCRPWRARQFAAVLGLTVGAWLAVAALWHLAGLVVEVVTR